MRAWLALSLLLWALAGCAGLPAVDRPALASEGISASMQTNLGRIAGDYLPDPLHSGFRLMPLGSYSLDTRVELARRAQVSLDVQYYHFENDETGRWLLRAMRDAALRGVRVRLLIDDFYTSGQDGFFLAFAAHPNVEVRLFNPFVEQRPSGKATRFVSAVGDWKRVNHRMHNKLFIADGAMAVIGGRNVANEYFLRSASENFIDVDAFVVGFVVAPLQGALRPLLEQRRRVSAAGHRRTRRRCSRTAPALRGADRPGADPAPAAAATERPARLRADQGRPRRRPPRVDLGVCLRLCRPPGQALRRRSRR